MIYLDITSEIQKMARNAFPDYRGRKYRLNNKGHVDLKSYWDGGSRNYFVVLRLDDNIALKVPQNGTMFDGLKFEKFVIPPGYLVVEHSIFMGKDYGITFHINPETSLGFLPKAHSLTSDERTVLKYTMSHKNTYAGETNVRYREANREMGITAEEWEYAKITCIAKGLITRGNAITNSGRNAIE